MKPEDFVPQYDSGVLEYHTTSPKIVQPINQLYCLMPSSALVLAGLFPDKPKVVFAPPIPQAPGSPFGFNRAVPWLEFPDGTRRNAGQLATYWGMPGVPLTEALTFAKWDVSTPVEVQ